MTQQHIRDKAVLIKIPSRIGICSSIIAAECMYRSDWGSKEVAKKENNLFLLEKDEFSRSKGALYDGKYYKTYDNWLEFSIDLGDYYVFTKKYNEVLQAKNLDEQLDLLPNVQDYPKSYCETIEDMIDRYGLWEFDVW